MPATLVTRSPWTGTVLRSLQGYVVPRFVAVTAGSHGIVTGLAVRPHEIVQRGQTIASLERLASHRERDSGDLVVAAPIAGLVTRCWVTAGDVVSGVWPIVPIASSEGVTVVARFSPESTARLRRGAPATVRFHSSTRATFPATIESVIEAPEPSAVEGAPDRRATRVVLSLPRAPATALWPGTAAQVEVAV